ncbi:MAG: nucleotidyltransferase family protein [Nitrospinae bacterium]|nr:nucleotidyltransferase family protein [Nitrospinota bacterium]
MKTRDEIIRLLEREKPRIMNRYKVRRLALFGSYARGDQNESSDVDILVDADPSIGLEFVTLADELERILGQRVELVSARAVNKRNMEIIQPELVDVE